MYQTPSVRKGKRKEQNSVCSNRDFVEKNECGGRGEEKAKRENIAMILGSKLGWGLGAHMALDSQPRATVIGFRFLHFHMW